MFFSSFFFIFEVYVTNLFLLYSSQLKCYYNDSKVILHLKMSGFTNAGNMIMCLQEAIGVKAESSSLHSFAEK